MHDTVISRSLIAQMLGLIKLMRPERWVKNSLFWLRLVLSGAFLDAWRRQPCPVGRAAVLRRFVGNVCHQ